MSLSANLFASLSPVSLSFHPSAFIHVSNCYSICHSILYLCLSFDPVVSLIYTSSSVTLSPCVVSTSRFSVVLSSSSPVYRQSTSVTPPSISCSYVHLCPFISLMPFCLSLSPSLYRYATRPIISHSLVHLSVLAFVCLVFLFFSVRLSSSIRRSSTFPISHFGPFLFFLSFFCSVVSFVHQFVETNIQRPLKKFHSPIHIHLPSSFVFFFFVHLLLVSCIYLHYLYPSVPF